MRSFPTSTTSAGSFATTPSSRARGVPQLAAIMGNCVAGGAYLPVLCDTVLMTEGSGLYLAGPALVKAAIGQEISHDDLGGAHVHAAISGTVDYREPDDDACLARLRRLIALLPPDPGAERVRAPIEPPARPADSLYNLVSSDPSAQYDMRELLAAILDGGRFDEYRAEYGRSLVCGFGYLGGIGLLHGGQSAAEISTRGRRPVPVRRCDLRRTARIKPGPPFWSVTRACCQFPLSRTSMVSM